MPGFNLKQGHEASVTLGTVGSCWCRGLEFQKSLVVQQVLEACSQFYPSPIPQEKEKNVLSM